MNVPVDSPWALIEKIKENTGRFLEIANELPHVKL